MTRLIPLSQLMQDRNQDFSNLQDSPIHLSAYGENREKVGRITDVLTEEGGRIRYLLVDVGGWFSSKVVAVPVGLARIDDEGVYFDTLTKEQVQNLRAYVPGQEFTFDAQLADESTWLKPGNQAHAGTHNATLEAAQSHTYARADEDAAHVQGQGQQTHLQGQGQQTHLQGQDQQHTQLQGQQHTTQRYDYETKGELFDTPNRLRLLEERLLVDKERYVAGSVEVGKRVETRTENINVDLQHEEIVIERHPVSGQQAVEGDVRLGADQQTIRVDLEAERANVQKQAFVTEEVEVGKRTEVERETFTETVGKEVLEVNQTGNVDVRADHTATGTLRNSTQDIETELERNQRLEREQNSTLSDDTNQRR